MARTLTEIGEYISLDEAARLYIRPANGMTLPEYSDKLRIAKSVIQRAINDGQIHLAKSGDGKITLASFQAWLNSDKVQIGLWIRRDIWEKFKQANEGKNLSYEIEKLISRL